MLDEEWIVMLSLVGYGEGGAVGNMVASPDDKVFKGVFGD